MLSKSSDDTEKFGELLGQKLKGGEVIELASDLGGGKTTFVRGLARGAGSSDAVASPTFMIQKRYTCPNFTICHFDLYRLGDDKQMIEMTLSEETDSGDVVVVEWAERVRDGLPEVRVTIEFNRDSVGEDYRQIKCSFPESLNYLFEGLAK